ncbi:MAG: hypothetical protein JO354_06155 [Verrucomicrobia bacterium]|nr:hypothetical protein [Verrucomicrobiota bacterium]
MKRQAVLLTTAAALSAVAIYSLTRSDKAEVKSVTLLSDPYHLDKIYRSMEGPFSISRGIQLTASSKASLEWVTGVEMQVVDATKQKPVSQEFFCHSNLTFAEHSVTPMQYNQRDGGRTHFDWRLFTLVPGRLSIQLPEGFGMLVPGGASLDYLTMSLNMNATRQPVDVRMRTLVHTITAGQPGAPTKALFRRALYVLQPQRQAASSAFGAMDKVADHVGAGCADGSCKVNWSAVSSVGKAGKGQTPHWMVPQGRHTYTTDITPQLNLPFDTTIHYATIHVHPYASSMELRDVTTGTTVLRLGARDWPDRLGVAHVDEVKSIEGIPIFRGHQYELTTQYDNISSGDTDAMAILYLYLLEKSLT